ncbi:MAG: hypothetical protein JSU66_06735 [Deltaproteobacteria bacterium]|nr:MAG: hypothetical protein JSU66_06735 [Deltaproteobacteria bacterium]
MNGSLRSALLVALVAAVSSCASSWDRAQSLDTPAAYHRFLREHPGSRHAAEARERIDYLRFRTEPSVEAFEAFQRAYPESVHVAELERLLEQAQFAVVRAAGSASAYRAFLERYPSGGHAAQVRGDLEHLLQNGFVERPEQLGDFLSRFPESEYAAEARRTVETLSVRDRTRIREVELVIDVDPSTPGPDELARQFAERAAEIYDASGVRLVAARPDAGSEPGSGTRLTIRHRERPIGTQLQGGLVSRGGILAKTAVTLQQGGADKPIWSRTFEFRGGALDPHPGRSLLFSARAQRYWASFFVPVATWSTDAAVRPAISLRQASVALATAGDRAIVLSRDGTFRVLNIADPANVEFVSEYVRPRDLTEWSGVHVWGRRIAIFGHDGAEIVALRPARPTLVRAFGREQVGSIRAAAAVDGVLLLGGNRGLFAVSDDGSSVTPLRAGPIHALARMGARILFVDDSAFHVSTLEALRAGQIAGSVRLGRVFGPARIRPSALGASLVANGSVTRLDVSNPAQPRIAGQLRAKHVGVVNDAVWIGGRMFLLGERGLQLLGPRGERVVDSADVRARMRVDATGRHLVAIEENHLQVIDATPLAAGPPAPAASPG